MAWNIRNFLENEYINLIKLKISQMSDSKSQTELESETSDSQELGKS